MEEYEEYNEVGPVWKWILLVMFSAGIIGWGVLLHTIIPDTERHWDFGVVPDTPAESEYSTRPSTDVPETGAAQVELAPEGEEVQEP